MSAEVRFAATARLQRPLVGALSVALFGAPLLASATASTPQAPQNWPVQTCNDATGPGSLRYIADHAVSGDTIDFSQLPTLCGMRDSTITLTAGEVVLHQADITLKGPPPGSGTVTLSANNLSRVLKHQVAPSVGTLNIQYLRIKYGNATDVGNVRGGCIYSDANIDIFGSSVSGCSVSSEMGNAYGGGIGQEGTGRTVTVTLSTISGNTADADNTGNGIGGGVSAWSLVSRYSNFIGNAAAVQGGGASVLGDSLVKYSTFADNDTGGSGGAIGHWIDTNLMIVNSTLSGNHSYGVGGAVLSGGNLEIDNSTVAFNTSGSSSAGGAYFKGDTVTLRSTIVANNSSATQVGADLFVKVGMLVGTDNAVMSSNVNPAGVITVTSDPMLAPLSWIGGPTRTHGLMPGSGLISKGSNAINQTYDQRGAGFLRTTGPTATVDIGAVQFDDRIFVSNFDRFFF